MALSIQKLQSIKFMQLTLAEKIEIKTKDRSTLGLSIFQTAVSNNKKNQILSSLMAPRINWLCGCEIRNALFCFPCILMDGDSYWTKLGSTNIRKLKDTCEKHSTSKQHIQNAIF